MLGVSLNDFQVINEVDENGDGVVQFDEFVQMISNMRTGKSSFKLAMLLNLLPDGNEVSENARNRLEAFVTALRSASVRLANPHHAIARPCCCTSGCRDYAFVRHYNELS